jgi:hypothetical protein
MSLERLTILFFVVMLVSSCTTTYSDGAYETIEGTYFNPKLVSNIKDGETTEDRLYADFGTPLSVNIDKDGRKIVIFKCLQKRDSEKSTVFRTEKYSQTVERVLTTTLLNGVVIHHEYTMKDD